MDQNHDGAQQEQFRSEIYEIDLEKIDEDFQAQSSLLESTLQLSFLELVNNNQYDEKSTIIAEYQSLKFQKEKLKNSNIELLNSGRIDQYQQESKSMNTILEQLNLLNLRLVKLELENSQIRKKNNQLEEEVQHCREELKTQQLRIDDVLEKSGFYETVQIIDGWQKYKDIADIYEYMKVFYWTFVNLIDGYRVAKTGILQVNTKHTVDKKQDRQMKLTKMGLQILEDLPEIGKFFSYFEEALDVIYGKIKKKDFNHRVKVINLIIMYNNNQNSISDQDFNRQIALAVIKIVEGNIQIMVGKTNPQYLWQHNQRSEKFMSLIQNSVQDFKHKLQKNRMNFYQSSSGQQAIADVMYLIIYMEQNYENIIEMSSTQQMADILANALLQKKSLTDFNLDEDQNTNPEKNPSKQEQSAGNCYLI